MYEDIIGTDKKEEYYFINNYLKPIYNCVECNLTLTSIDSDEETKVCPVCGKLVKK
jgi:rubrerythrin